jgi:hypothetical protein
VIKPCYDNGQKERLCLIIDKCRRQKLCKRAQKISAAAPLRVMVISLRLGFRRNFLSVLHPNLVSSPIKGILEILNLTPPVHSDGYFGMDGLCQIKCR